MLMSVSGWDFPISIILVIASNYMPIKFETETVSVFRFNVPRKWRFDVKTEFHKYIGEKCPSAIIMEDTEITVGNAFIVFTVKRFREKAEAVITESIEAFNAVNTARKEKDNRGLEGPRFL
jgi:hypothetical protein